MLKSLVAFHGNGGVLKAVTVLFMAVEAYLFPSDALKQAAVAAGILVVLDTATGTLAAFVTSTPRSSAKFARALTKVFAYLAVCTVAAAAEKTFGQGSGLPVTMGVLWLIVATEGLSVIENAERITGGKFRVLRAVLGKAARPSEDDRPVGP